ncbi:hypothetical protein P43SY_008502 [Pythium insidiosum]|uniref:AB hydrolase-1 domain-containing protein n=1 Tax=Pythium insidiosum TaxID=114742 RepID=A0AAD5QAW3_PYTIN|nr:hypothetical protein P43SY_008502 [Pythium insidiosum]
MRFLLATVFGAVAALQLASTAHGTASNATFALNGWYPCGMSEGDGANATVGTLADLPFECAQVRAPFCHEGVCVSDRTIDLFVKRIRPSTTVKATKALWLIMGGPGIENLMLDLNQRFQGSVNVYTVDHRGVGRSFYLKCTAAQALTGGSPSSCLLDYIEGPNCAKDVLFQIDNKTEAFSTTSAAKDIVYLVKHLNTEGEVYVYGASYGSYLTARVMHLAPTTIKGYILDGVVSERNGSFARISSNRISAGKYFASLCEKDSVCLSKYAYGGQAAIPSLLKMLDRCKPDDVKTLRSVFQLQPNESIASSIDRLTLPYMVPPTFNEITDDSYLLMYVIKVSEMWLYPSPAWEDEQKLASKGVFSADSTADYAFYCLFNGDWNDPACSALRAWGKRKNPPQDYSNLTRVSFKYARDEYHGKVAKVPSNASVMFMQGRLDFQTVFDLAKYQYDQMEGTNKVFVEFPYGGHCPGVQGDCGAAVIASFVSTGGSVPDVNTSCIRSLPAINFDVDTQIAQRVAEFEGGNKGNSSAPHNTADYAFYCLLNGDWNDPACSALKAWGKRKNPPQDYSNLTLVPFKYERNQYFGKVAKVPSNASLLFMQGHLDFQTVFDLAKDQYDQMEGTNKVFVEFPYGGHCPALYGGPCGAAVLASFVSTGGSVTDVNTSCIRSLPAINFDVDAQIAQRVAKFEGGNKGNSSVPRGVRSDADSSRFVGSIAVVLVSVVAVTILNPNNE